MDQVHIKTQLSNMKSLVEIVNPRLANYLGMFRLLNAPQFDENFRESRFGPYVLLLPLDFGAIQKRIGNLRPLNSV